MIPIAGVLLLIIVIFTVAVVVSNPAVFDLSLFGARISVNTAGIYFTGAGAMLVLILAADLMRRGLKRRRARRRQVKALKTAAQGKRVPTPVRPAAARSAAPPPNEHPTSSTNTKTSVNRSSGADDPGTGPATAAERQALLDEAEELTGDGSDR
jgi:hypothetical protein